MSSLQLLLNACEEHENENNRQVSNLPNVMENAYVQQVLHKIQKQEQHQTVTPKTQTVETAPKTFSTPVLSTTPPNSPTVHRCSKWTPAFPLPPDSRTMDTSSTRTLEVVTPHRPKNQSMYGPQRRDYSTQKESRYSSFPYPTHRFDPVQVGRVGISGGYVSEHDYSFPKLREIPEAFNPFQKPLNTQ